MFEWLIVSSGMWIIKGDLSRIVTENGVRLNALMQETVIPPFSLLLSRGQKCETCSRVTCESTVEGLFLGRGHSLLVLHPIFVIICVLTHAAIMAAASYTTASFFNKFGNRGHLTTP